jgi:cytochrome bd-type quinol oxidase subunit 2
MQRTILCITLIAFTALTVLAVWHHGYWGVISSNFQDLAALQVFADLAIALSLCLVWLWRDAQQRGRLFWGWAVITLFLGALGPLLYLITRKEIA